MARHYPQRHTVECEACGEPFMAAQKRARFCSDDCRRHSNLLANLPREALAHKHDLTRRYVAAMEREIKRRGGG